MMRNLSWFQSLQQMAKLAQLKWATPLTAEERRDVPAEEFAYTSRAPKGQDKEEAKGKYPMMDMVHARSAMGFAAMHHGKDSAEYRRVVAKARQLGYL